MINSQEIPPSMDPETEKMWRENLLNGIPEEVLARRFFRYLPSNPRCKYCYAPFEGVGGSLVKLFLHKQPSSHNPLICNVCENHAKSSPGGAEIEMSMLFADVRGSTSLAEKMSPSAFSQLINRFYNMSIDVLSHSGAMIDRLVGDEMIGYFLPGFAGKDHAALAVEAAKRLMHAAGYTSRRDPWIPLGIGVHTGVAFYGAVGRKNGIIDLTALGDAVNITARIASQAQEGEILVSDSTYTAAHLSDIDSGTRSLDLKGKSQPVTVHSLHAG